MSPARHALLAGAGAMLLASAGAVLSAPASPDATVIQLPDKASTYHYPVYDARGRQIRTATWRVTRAGGNCCEVYVAATAAGRLVELGGDYPLYSDDRGETWYQVVNPLRPSAFGEGAIAAAPNGDVVGVLWDFLGGTYLQAVKYDARAEKWRFAKVPVYPKSSDRPWITAVRGPFTVDGATVPYVTIISGDYMKDTILVSTDGLSYDDMSGETVLSEAGTTRTGPLKVVADPGADWLAGDRYPLITPLAGGGALHIRDDPACPLAVLDRSAEWVCQELPGGPVTGLLRSDSRGWLHEVSARDQGGAIRYRLSRDGGATWRTTTLRDPHGGRLVLPYTGYTPTYDVKVNGRLGVAVVHGHVRMPSGRAQDMAFRIDYGTGTPRLREVLHLGLGDLDYDWVRLDLATVALLPDGRIVAMLVDSTTISPFGYEPFLAIER